MRTWNGSVDDNVHIESQCKSSIWPCPPCICFNCSKPEFACANHSTCNAASGICEDCPIGFGGDDCRTPLCGNPFMKDGRVQRRMDRGVNARMAGLASIAMFVRGMRCVVRAKCVIEEHLPYIRHSSLVKQVLHLSLTFSPSSPS